MLSVDQLIDLEEKIRTHIQELESAVQRASSDTAAVSPDAAIGRLSRLDSMQQQQMSLATVRRQQERIAQLEEALRRMEAGDFGICSKCFDDIEYDRLEAAPESTVCARCALGSR